MMSAAAIGVEDVPLGTGARPVYGAYGERIMTVPLPPCRCRRCHKLDGIVG